MNLHGELRRPAFERPRATGRWHDGNAVRLLENGEEFFPRAFEAIAGARHEILIETFILFEDKVGLELHRHLIEAAKRGVRVDLTVDGWGSPSFSHDFVRALVEAGVRFHVFDPHRQPFGMRVHYLFRRMHRKLLVVDGRIAFIGGINYSADHLLDYGPGALQDYSVELEGPIVADLRDFAAAQVAPWPSRDAALSTPPPRAGDARVLFATRDNAHCRTDIEHRYRHAIRAARHEVLIANAYFFPSHGLLSELRRAARRGVSVTLILAGRSDERIATFGARTLYKHLIRAGVQVFEYGPRPFHGKVALIDDDWATVGSSNLDPLSLSLNLEANVFIRDAGFNRHLRKRLMALRDAHCRRIDIDSLPHSTLWQAVTGPIAYHVLRRFPRWAGLLPAHTPKQLLLRPHPPGQREPAT
jgi:cardiolipin synthase